MTKLNTVTFSKNDSVQGIYNKAFVNTEEGGTQSTVQTSNILHRPAFTSKTLEAKYGFRKVESENLLKNTSNYLKKYYQPNRSCMKNFFFAKFPFFLWIFSYNFKENFMKDLLSGLTVRKRF